MKGILRLTLRYLLANRAKSLLLVICLTVTFFLPVALNGLIEHCEEDLLRRAMATPAVIGAKGDRYDLVLKALYFNGDAPEAVSMEEVNRLRALRFGTMIPLHMEYSARGYPVVGTALEYFEFRGMTMAEHHREQRRE